MKIELFLARRMRLGGRGKRASAPSMIIAVTGVSLAVIIMILSICIVLGFKHEIREKVMGFDSHITVYPMSGYGDGADGSLINYSDTIRGIIATTLPDAHTSLTLDRPGILKTADDFKGIVLRGMSADGNWNFVKENLVEGALPDYANDSTANHVVISQAMASALGLKAGDKMHAYFFHDNHVRARNLLISGIYNSHFSDYDNVYAFTSLSLTQGLSQALPHEGSRIEIRLDDTRDIELRASDLQQALSAACYTGKLYHAYNVDNVNHSGMMYFNWIALLDTNVVVILILMALVSGFTLISSLFIIILERVNMIGILKALGATNAQVRRTFIYLAERIVLKGLLIGDIVGLAIVLLQRYARIIPLDPEAYYLNYVPVEINWWYMLLLNAGVIAVSMLMLILPSQLISSISPAKAIKYD